MAEEESSRLLANSEDFRTCSIAKNSPALAKDSWGGYIPGTEYCAGSPDTLSDGDNRGRDPETEGGVIGTQIDIKSRECSMAKNADGYTPNNEYGPSHNDTISDGDNKGRDPESQGAVIGTQIDINMRECLMAKNADGYTPGKQYCAGSPDTIADGDDKGREPEATGLEAGTCIDFQSRDCSMAKNANLYTKNRQYGFGNGTV